MMAAQDGQWKSIMEASLRAGLRRFRITAAELRFS